MSTYQQTIREIYELQEFAIKLGLDNIIDFAQRLGHPERQYPIIHIAGTNGKGSTAFYVASFLQAHGLSVGLYTSPHLKDYRERIRVNGEKIAPEYVIDFWQTHKEYVYGRKATFFDTTTALGFDYFARKKVDVAVIETGLGGRLDSTNIVHPEQVLLTPVDFDHQKQLGDTLRQIAAEKAGIIKENAAVFSAAQHPVVQRVFKEHISEGNRFYYLPDHLQIHILNESLDAMEFALAFRQDARATHTFESRQVGRFQADNIALALFSVQKFLERRGQAVNYDKMRQVLQHKIWPGRLQTIQKKPRIVFDVSHNLAGIQKTVSYIKKICPTKKIWLLMGLLETKDYKSIVTYLSKQNLNVLLTEPNTHKKLAADVLEKEFIRQGLSTRKDSDAYVAFQKARSRLDESQLLLVMGSHYLIGDLMNRLKL